MKKIFTVILVSMMLIFSPLAFADTQHDGTATATATSTGGNASVSNVSATGGSGGAGGSATIQAGAIQNSPTYNNSAVNVNKPVNTLSQTQGISNSGNSSVGNGFGNFSPNASATIQKGAVQNYNANVQGQKQGQQQQQGQKQGQGQSQSVNNGQTVAPVQNVNTPAMLQAPEINPFYLMPLQGGRVGDATGILPRFANAALVKLTANDVVVKILDVYFGNPFSRITYDELESYLLNKASKYDATKKKIRYSVKFQDSVITSGMGGGAALSNSGADGTMSSTGSILPGISKSTANPIFIITFYEVR
jgi:hypothetical protein